MRNKKTKQKNNHEHRIHKNSTTLHDQNMVESTKYEGSHTVIGEEARKSRDKARRHNDRLI